MQLMIDIDEDIYNRFTHNEAKLRCEITEEERFQMSADAIRLTRAFCNGIPLPKGHGDLIDRGQALNECYNITIDGDVFKVVQYETLLGVPTIIEADSTESEAEEKKKTEDSIKAGDEVISEYNVKSVVFKNNDFDNLDSMLEDLWNDTESEMNE